MTCWLRYFCSALEHGMPCAPLRLMRLNQVIDTSNDGSWRIPRQEDRHLECLVQGLAGRKQFQSGRETEQSSARARRSFGGARISIRRIGRGCIWCANQVIDTSNVGSQTREEDRQL